MHKVEEIRIQTVSNVSQHGHTETFENKIYGKRVFRGSSEFLLFEEEIQVDEKNVKTTVRLQLKERELILTRNGASQFKLHFQDGLSTIGVIHTPTGDLSVEIATRELSMERDKQQGKVKIAYELFHGGQSIGTFEFSLSFSKK